MTLSIDTLEEILAIIGFAVSMLLVAYVYFDNPKQKEPETDEQEHFIGMRVGEHCDN